MLNSREWKEFNFIDIFDIKGGFYNKKPPMEENGTIPFLGATENNNGITEFYSMKNIEKNSKTGSGVNEALSKKIFQGNCICVTNNGSVGYAYYQVTKFTCSHDVNPLYLKHHKLNRHIALFLINAIEQQRVCFRYSRKWRPSRMIKSKIMLPIANNGQPDYDFMAQYIRKREDKLKQKYIDFIGNNYHIGGGLPSLENKAWAVFNLKDLFDIIQRGKRLVREHQQVGTMPYVSSTAMNNGIDGFISTERTTREFSNCLTIANSGSVGSSFYQPSKFIASDHITHLKNDSYTMYVYLFIATMTKRMSEKYNFNREINDYRISKEKILLPTTDEGSPDYEYMEQYIKSVIFVKYKNYLAYQNCLTP